MFAVIDEANIRIFESFSQRLQVAHAHRALALLEAKNRAAADAGRGGEIVQRPPECGTGHPTLQRL